MIQPRHVLAAVSSAYGIPIDVLRAYDRHTPDVVEARFVYYALCRELTDCAAARIGLAVHRDHSTVLHGHKRVRQHPERYCGMMTAIRRKLTP